MHFKPFDANGVFENSQADGRTGVRDIAVRSAGVTLFSGGLSLAVQTIATLTLARLVSPKAFGLVTIVTTISLLFASFGDSGLPEAIVQRRNINSHLASNLFWINTFGGCLLAFCFAASAPLFARAYHEPELRRVVIGISPTLLFYSTATVHLALLKRAMRFSEASIVTVCARTVSVAVSILMAVAGYGYWALVAGAVALPLTQTLVAWYICRWMPGLPQKIEGTGSTYWFAFNTYGRFCLNYGTSNADNVLVGWSFSARALGFYKRAYDLFNLSATQFTNALTLVVVSALNRIDHKSPEYTRFLLGALTSMGFLGMGLAAVLTVAGHDLIRVLLGPGWHESGRIFTYFGPGIGAMILYYTHGWIHLSIGRADRWLRWGIVEFVVTVGLFLLALRWGPAGIAIAWTVAYWLLTIPALWYAGRPIGFSVRPVIAGIWRYVVASLIAGLLSYAIVEMSPWLAGAPDITGAALRVVVSGLLVVSLYLGSIAVLHRSLAPIWQVLELIKLMVKTRRSPAEGPVPIRTPAASPEPAARSGPAAVHAQPLVSILIPAYNAERWIAEAIESALAQTWPNKEIIVVDDGSTDRTVTIARRFGPDRVRVELQYHAGAAAARNRAFSLSRGDYIQWLDADDLLAPDKIARQMEALAVCEGKRTLVSAAWGCFMYRRQRAIFRPSAVWCDLSPTEWVLRKLEQNAYIQTGAWLVSRELTEAAGPWDTRLLGDDDGEYFCRVALQSELIRFVHDAKAYYRLTGSNSLSNVWFSKAKLEAQWLSMQLHVRYVMGREDSSRSRAACINYLQRWLICFFPEYPHLVVQAEQRTRDLGGKLQLPELSWKYNWIRRTFGWRQAKRIMVLLPATRWSLARAWDHAMLVVEKEMNAGGASGRLGGAEGGGRTAVLSEPG